MSSILYRRSIVAPTFPLDKSHFTFDTSGLTSLFGGDEVMSAITTVHVYQNRRWLGWYNSPGSYQIAKRYGLLAKSRFFDAFSPGIHSDPATFKLEGWKSPKFKAVHSGTIIEETGHLAALFMKECAAREAKAVRGRKTQVVKVTIAELDHTPPSRMYPNPPNMYSTLFSSIPIAVSVGSCATCGVLEDWFAFSSILLGILTNGISCLVMGSEKLVFTHPDPSDGCSPGDGILSSDKEIVLLKGTEGAVSSVTHGRFSLGSSSESCYRNIRLCSILFTIQFIAQLFLIPQGSLFGQTIFVASLGVSWIYDSLLSCLDKERIQQDILLNSVLQSPVLTKHSLGTRTTMVVFVLLVLQPKEPTEILNEFLPDDTKVWRQWKEMIVRRLLDKERLKFVNTDWELDGFSQQERCSLEMLFGDAQAAYGGYVQYIASR